MVTDRHREPKRKLRQRRRFAPVHFGKYLSLDNRVIHILFLEGAVAHSFALLDTFLSPEFGPRGSTLFVPNINPAYPCTLDFGDICKYRVLRDQVPHHNETSPPAPNVPYKASCQSAWQHAVHFGIVRHRPSRQSRYVGTFISIPKRGRLSTSTQRTQHRLTSQTCPAPTNRRYTVCQNRLYTFDYIAIPLDIR